MLTELLKFNPDERLTAKKCLESTLFDDIRVPQLEREAPFRIYLGCDETVPGVKESNESKFSLKEMRKVIMEELN
jgi:hypothetical protein